MANFMKKTKFFFALIVTFLSGCFGFEPFQPNPPEYQVWSRPGVTEMDVKKAMLECGYPNPYELRYSGQITTLDDIANINKCMISNGFSYGKDGYDFCDHHGLVKACQHGSVIPSRDVNKRINGGFCRAHSSDPVCQ